MLLFGGGGGGGGKQGVRTPAPAFPTPDLVVSILLEVSLSF